MTDEPIKFRTEKSEPFLDWNIIKLEHISNNRFRYILDSSNIKGITDMSSSAKQFYLQLAFYGDESGDDWLDIDDSSLVATGYVPNGEGSVIVESSKMKTIKN